MGVPSGVVSPNVQAGVKREELDLVTLQAVLELRDALRALDEMQHADLAGRSEEYRGMHARDMSRARIRHLNARSSLELVLLGDE